ncbi:PAS domain-containing protein [Haematococcus lacustris]|uniref:PAS domain-containing protein n=1 Tax=Haematococcus lacustris TaxID=44745 RepID=A0A699Z3N0_HAELA|nr:PAS domain-containing protein [Haematococcus lacustris]
MLLWLIWPIAVWGPTVMLFYAIGYQLMATINGPISLFNIVSFTQLLYNANNFFLQELTFEPNPVKMPGLRAGTVERIKELEMHYKVMLYGHESMPTAATAPYITLVSSGVTYTGSHGNYILFDTKKCLARQEVANLPGKERLAVGCWACPDCSNKSECQPPSSPLYPWTHSGLDTMMSHYMEIGTSITQFQYLDPYLNGPEYNFYWNTIPDMSGGFERLSEAYQVFVNDNLRVVLSLHICLFVFTLVLMAVYVGLMVLPFVKVTRNETRRIAELVSQLPAEVDMEATLAKAQMAELLLGPAVPPPHGAIKSSKSLKKSRSLGSGSSH